MTAVEFGRLAASIREWKERGPARTAMALSDDDLAKLSDVDPQLIVESILSSGGRPAQ